MSSEQNKALILQYNKEVIEKGDMEALKRMASPDFTNHSAPDGMPSGLDGLIYFFSGILHPAFSDLKVEVLDMIADEHKVATRKRITGVHTGELMGIPATGKNVTISIIDILSITDGKVTGHWGENSFVAVMQELRS